MKLFTLRFIATAGFVSEAIKFVEGAGAHADHVEALNRAGDGWIGAHAGCGVANLPLDWAKDILWERQYQLPLSDQQYEAAMAFLEHKIGTPYDYSDILGIAFRDARIEDQHRFICSALQYDALWTAGVFMLNIVPEAAHLVHPDALHMSPLLIGCASYIRL